jgi:hypothetical protein
VEALALRWTWRDGCPPASRSIRNVDASDETVYAGMQLGCSRSRYFTFGLPSGSRDLYH